MFKARIDFLTERFPIAGDFTISRGTKREAIVVTTKIVDGEIQGQGECVPYARYGETVESVLAQLEGVRGNLAELKDPRDLQALMPRGAARNSLDAALWDYFAKASGRRVYNMLGLAKPAPVHTAYTISLGAADEMAENARKQSQRPLLKIKLGTAADAERLKAVRSAAPGAALIVDANEGWNQANVIANLKLCQELGVCLVEQPLPEAEDEFLASFPHPVPICADESVHDREDLPRLAKRYEAINVKLDKTGGLTEAFALIQAARSLNFKIMVGCMVGSSLAMAPAHLLAQLADFVDLDGPLLLSRDRSPSIQYQLSEMLPPDPLLWG